MSYDEGNTAGKREERHRVPQGVGWGKIPKKPVCFKEKTLVGKLF